MRAYIAIDRRWSERYARGLGDYMEGTPGDYELLYETVCLFLYWQLRIDRDGNPPGETDRLMQDIVQGAHLEDIPFSLLTQGWVDLYYQVRPQLLEISDRYDLRLIEPIQDHEHRLIALDVRCWSFDPNLPPM